MTRIFAERSAEKRREGEALIREADNLACQSWNEKMWSDGGPIDPSPTLAGPLVCQKCEKAEKRRAATLLQLTPRSRHQPSQD
jgi:hypothetical protein